MNMILLLAALSGALAVGAGAFGAHGASGAAAEWLTTGGQYQLIPEIAALVALQLGARGPARHVLAGGPVFAGSLYFIATGLHRWAGTGAPVAGVLVSQVLRWSGD